MEERSRVDKTVKWPTGTGAKGNSGVAGAVKQTDGSVGYVEEAYALQNNFTTADMKNKSGKFVAPSLDSTSAAAARASRSRPTSVRRDRLVEPGRIPDCVGQFLLVYEDMCKAASARGRPSG